MSKCDPNVYEKTVYAGTGFVTKGKDAFLVSGVRFVPANELPKKFKGQIKIGSVYTLELRGNQFGATELWDSM
jgi:hypothetical protein